MLSIRHDHLCSDLFGIFTLFKDFLRMCRGTGMPKGFIVIMEVYRYFQKWFNFHDSLQKPK